MNSEGSVINIAVNARFRQANRPTGVQNWSSYVTNEIAQIHGLTVKEYKPNRMFSTGMRGHLWEQLILPILARRSNVLFSPANSGPVLFKKQLVCIHDAMVFTHPEFFSTSYRLISKFLLKMFNWRDINLVTVSINSKENIEFAVGSKSRIAVVGMGLPTLDTKVRPESNDHYFLFIGGDIQRKNLNFLLRFWSSVHELTGYYLKVVIGNDSASLSKIHMKDILGVKYIANPTNLELSHLYQGCRSLLWPSIAEGFGIPLVEAMAFGKSFISTPVGAAQELKVGESRVIPLVGELWEKEIVHKASSRQIDSDKQRIKSQEYNWAKVAQNVRNELIYVSKLAH
jgi:glycosyltransferase involved in cell wall biosynthesis